MGVPVGPKNVIIGSLFGKPNAKKIVKIYNEAFEQISSLWKMLPESAITCLKSDVDQSESMEVEGSLSAKSKISDLEERVNSLKGKQNSYKEKMAKKKFKNQLKKKKKSEEKRLLKEEVRQKKKELKEQKLAQKTENGGIVESQLEKRISQVAEDLEDSDEDVEENQLEESEEEGSVEKPMPMKSKKKQQKKVKIEEMSHEDTQENGNEDKQVEGLSKKKIKYLNKMEHKAEKKREKRKLWKMKKKEEALAKAQELIETKIIPTVPVKKQEDTEVMFNKIDVEGENVKKKFKKEKPRTEKDPVKALNKIEELNKKITDLKETGNEEKAAAIKSKELWKAAILKADGVKVKDDVKLLKKTIRKKEKQKTKSKTDWAKRKEVTEKKIADAQKKRKENIQKKKKEKKQKKIKKSIKKGRVVI